MSDKVATIPRSHNLEARVLAQLPEGEEINARTAADIRFFQSHPNLWVNIKANEDAQSCDDAALKRRQLGSEGTPLYKELKTIASIYLQDNGKYQIVVAHCPADENFDNAALKEAVGTKSKLSRFRTEAIPFGTFSPFLFDRQFIEEELKAHSFEVEKKGKWKEIDLDQLDPDNPVLQVFHRTLVNHITWDYMTTNFGHHNLGVQFRPHEVITTMAKEGTAIDAVITRYDGPSSAQVHDLWEGRKSEYARHKVGIITGNSPSSGMLLMEKILDAHTDILGDAFKGDLSNPDIVLRSQHKFGLSMEMNANAHDIADVLREEAQKLLDDGCTIVSLACNTMDVFDDMLTAMCAKRAAIYVPINGLVKERLREIEATDVTILGADPVASLGHWSTYADLPEGYEVHKTPDIDDVGYAVKNRKSAAEQIEAARAVFNRITFGDLEEGKKPAVIAALTELSEIFTRQPEAKAELIDAQQGVEVIDTMDLYARTIADMIVNHPRAEQLYPGIYQYQRGILDEMIANPRVLRSDGMALTA